MRSRALVTVAIALALFFIAATIKSGWLYLVASATFSLVIVGLLSAWRATRKVSVERECPPEVFEGEPFTVQLRIRNDGWMSRYLTTVRDLQFAGGVHRGILGKMRGYRAETRRRAGNHGHEPGPRGDDRFGEGRGRTVAVERLGPGRTVDVTYRLVAPRRGVYEEAALAVASGGVFGNVDVRRSLKVRSPVTVFPRVYTLESFSMNPDIAASPVESFEWSRKGMGQDYYGVREYTRGDSLRHIHWKTSARRGRLIVKEYQQEFNTPSVLVVLLGPPRYGTGHSNSLEDGLRAAASIINYYSTTGRIPGLVLPGERDFEFIEGGTAQEMLTALAAYRPPPAAAGSLGAESIRDSISFARSYFMSARAMVVVTNIAADLLWGTADAMDGLGEGSLVLVAEESYAEGGETLQHERALQEGLLPGRVVNLYLLTRGRGISECLSEPLSTTV